MSLLSISRNVLDIVGWDALGAIASNQDKTARQIIALANQELTNVCKRFDWRHLVNEYEFDTVSGQAEYPMPQGYEKLMQDSIYNKDEYYRLRSGMTDHFWNAWNYGLLGSLSHQRFKVTLNTGSAVLVLAPPPDTAESFILWYKTQNYVMDDSGMEKQFYELDTDVSRIPEDVIQAGVLWRFRRAKGLDFSAELAEYNEVARTRYAQSRGEGDIPIPSGVLRPEITEGFVPTSGFGGV